VRRSRGRAGVGIGLFAAVWAAIAVFPTSLSREPAPAWPPSAGLEQPEWQGMVERVELQIGSRGLPLSSAEIARIAEVIVLEAEAARLDPLLVMALIQVESSFDPGALSHRGARGLMQLREPTLRRELARSGIACPDPHDPVANVQAGVRYLRRLMNAFGREEIALMAYNAGPNRILAYLREGGIPDRFHVYPRRVRAELRRLRRSLGEEPGPKVALAARPVKAGE